MGLKNVFLFFPLALLLLPAALGDSEGLNVLLGGSEGLIIEYGRGFAWLPNDAPISIVVPEVGVLDCVSGRSYTNQEGFFTCNLTKATGEQFDCYAVVKDLDGSVLSISPDTPDVELSGASGGVSSFPAGGELQRVGVTFSTQRLKAGSPANYSVLCVSNATAPEQRVYNSVLVPEHREAASLAEPVLAMKDSSGFFLFGFGLVLVVIVVAGAVVFLV